MQQKSKVISRFIILSILLVIASTSEVNSFHAEKMIEDIKQHF